MAMERFMRLLRGEPPVSVAALPVCISASSTHVGRVRKINEDNCLDRGGIGLWAVADGVGGGHAGDRASGLIVERLGALSPPSDAASRIAAVDAALGDVNAQLRREAADGDRVIASTVAALLLSGRRFTCAWAGDSRVYLLRDGQLRQISRDHSAVQELVDLGVVSPEDAKYHPRANVVTRAVGAQDKLEVETTEDEVRADDTFLLCTDGLTKMIEDDKIVGLLADRPPPAAVKALIDATLDRGATDNVTVVVVKVKKLPESNG
jgi:serine/threonine protein phosphatase PrpC